MELCERRLVPGKASALHQPERQLTVKRKLFLVLAALPAVIGFVLWWVPQGGALIALLRAYAVVFAALALGWLLAVGLRRFLWRVGRRLAFSYFLIGVVPIPLVGLLMLVLAYVGNGFFLGHLYRDAVHSVAKEVRVAAEQLRHRPARPEQTSVPVSFAYYVNGKKRAGDPRAPGDWQSWWVTETVETAAPSPIAAPFVALADGRPTIMAAVSEGRLGVLALYQGDLERELSERSGVWVELQRSDESSGRALTFTFRQREYPLKFPRLAWEDEELREFFHPGLDDPGLMDRPWLLWAEISRPFLDLASGVPASDYVAAGLTGSPRTIIFHLFSHSAEVDTFAYLAFIALAFVLFDIWVLAALMALLMISGLSRAVNRLSRATRRVQEGDFSTRIEIRRTDQIGELQRSFNQMTENLEALVVSATQKEILEKELEIARELQQSLLPGALATDETLAFATHFAPSAAIGGDYYDVLPVACPGGSQDGRRLAVVVADVSGHGLSAGLRMAMVKSALQLLCEQESSPEEILRRLDGLLRPRGGRGEPVRRPPGQGADLLPSSRGFVTATLTLIDRESGELAITNAGHSPTYLWRRGRVTEITLPSSPLGALGEDFGQETVQLEAGDAVVWLSDGLIEATNAWQEPFGYDGVLRSLQSLEAVAVAEDPAPFVRDRLLEALDEHTGGSLPEDDRTLVVMVYRPLDAAAAFSSAASSSAARPSAA